MCPALRAQRICDVAAPASGRRPPARCGYVATYPHLRPSADVKSASRFGSLDVMHLHLGFAAPSIVSSGLTSAGLYPGFLATSSASENEPVPIERKSVGRNVS